MAAPRAPAPAGAGAAARSPRCCRERPGRRRRRRALRRVDPAASAAAASAARRLPSAGDAALLSSPGGRTRDTLAGEGTARGQRERAAGGEYEVCVCPYMFVCVYNVCVQGGA